MIENLLNSLAFLAGMRFEACKDVDTSCLSCNFCMICLIFGTQDAHRYEISAVRCKDKPRSGRSSDDLAKNIDQQSIGICCLDIEVVPQEDLFLTRASSTIVAQHNMNDIFCASLVLWDIWS